MSLARSIAARMLAKKANPSTASKSSGKRPASPPASYEVFDELATFDAAAWESLPAQPLPQLPPRAIKPGWRGACQAVCAATGRRCRLPEHRVDEPHRHERGPFTITAALGQTITARSELEAAATSRTFNPITET